MIVLWWLKHDCDHLDVVINAHNNEEADGHYDNADVLFYLMY